MSECKVYSRPDSGGMFGFRVDRRPRKDGGFDDVYQIHAMRVHPVLGLLIVRGWVGTELNERQVWVEFVYDHRIIELRIVMPFSVYSHPTFSRQFNTTVMPELDAMAERLERGERL